MKFASGLVLAAVAVTAANAGNPNYLRKTEDESSHHETDNSVLLTRNPSSGKELTPDDLMIDLTEILGESTDSSHLKINILDLIGSGSDQVDLDDILDAFKDTAGSSDMAWLDEAGQEDEDGKHDPIKGEYKDNSYFTKAPHSKSDDLSWLNDFDDNSGSVDYDSGKGATKGAADSKDDDDSSSSDDLSWLDVDSMSGSVDVDDVVGGKGDYKGDRTNGKGKSPISGSVGMAWFYGKSGSDAVATKGDFKGEGHDDEDENQVGEKGATKGAFAYGKGEEAGKDDMSWLFADSGSDDVGVPGGKGADVYDDDDEPVAAKSATKGAGLLDDEDEPVAAKSATKGAGLYDDEDEPVAAKSATKGAGLFDDEGEPVAAKSATKGAGLFDDEDEPVAAKSATKGAALFDDEDEPVAAKSATKGAGLFDDEDEPVAAKSATKGAGLYDEDDDDVGVKGATKSAKSSKKGAADSTPLTLYGDGSKGQIGGEGLDEDKSPFIIAGATKGKASNVADDNDNGSTPDEDSADEVVQSGDDVEDDKMATKGSKQVLP